MAAAAPPASGRSGLAMAPPAADRRDAVAARLGGAAVVLLMLTFSPRWAEAGEQTLLLAVQVNGYPTDRIGEFVLRDGILLARRAELGELGFRVPAAQAPAASGPGGLVALSGLPRLSWRLDQATQTLHVEAGNDHLLPALLRVADSLPAAAVESGLGAALDYDINGTFAGGQRVVSGAFDARALSPWGASAREPWPMRAAGRTGPARSRRSAWTRPTAFPTRTRCAATARATSSPAASAGPVRSASEGCRSARISACAPTS